MVMVLVVVMVVLLVVIGNPLGKAHQLWHGRTLSFKRQEKKQASNENHPYFFPYLSPLSRPSCHVESAVLAFAPVKVALRSHWARTYIGTTILPAGFLRQVRVAPL